MNTISEVEVNESHESPRVLTPHAEKSPEDLEIGPVSRKPFSQNLVNIVKEEPELEQIDSSSKAKDQDYRTDDTDEIKVVV